MEQRSWRERMKRNLSPPPSPTERTGDEGMKHKDSKAIAVLKPKKSEDEYCKWNAAYNMYECSICDSKMNSEFTFVKHLEGKRHQKKLNTSRLVSSGNSEIPLDANMQEIRLGGEHKVLTTRTVSKPPKIQQTIDNEKQPIVGLKFVTEILRLDKKQDPIYHCSLCPADCQLSSIMGHITGLKHRLAYLALIGSPAYTKIMNLADKRSSQSDRAEQEAAIREKKDGRGEMVVEEEYKPSEDSNKENAKSISLTIEEIDFTQDKVRGLCQKEKSEVLLYALNCIFEEELEKRSAYKEHMKLFETSSDEVVEECLKGVINGIGDDTLSKVDESIMEGDPKIFDQLLSFPSVEVGVSTREAMQRLKEKGEFLFI